VDFFWIKPEAFGEQRDVRFSEYGRRHGLRQIDLSPNRNPSLPQRDQLQCFEKLLAGELTLWSFIREFPDGAGAEADTGANVSLVFLFLDSTQNFTSHIETGRHGKGKRERPWQRARVRRTK
jgi:hypothetical protein